MGERDHRCPPRLPTASPWQRSSPPPSSSRPSLSLLEAKSGTRAWCKASAAGGLYCLGGLAARLMSPGGAALALGQFAASSMAVSSDGRPRWGRWHMLATVWTKFVSMQNHYNLIYRVRRAGDEPAYCVAGGAGSTWPAGSRRGADAVTSPLARGILTGSSIKAASTPAQPIAPRARTVPARRKPLLGRARLRHRSTGHGPRPGCLSWPSDSTCAPPRP